MNLSFILFSKYSDLYSLDSIFYRGLFSFACILLHFRLGDEYFWFKYWRCRCCRKVLFLRCPHSLFLDCRFSGRIWIRAGFNWRVIFVKVKWVLRLLSSRLIYLPRMLLLLDRVIWVFLHLFKLFISWLSKLRFNFAWTILICELRIKLIIATLTELMWSIQNLFRVLLIFLTSIWGFIISILHYFQRGL